jgi:hypothetical protein
LIRAQVPKRAQVLELAQVPIPVGEGSGVPDPARLYNRVVVREAALELAVVAVKAAEARAVESLEIFFSKRLQL